jgi:hypothetical protein
MAATTYSVDRVVGPGRISGTIQTNGNTGVLSAADIIDWNLTIDADGDSATTGQLLGPLSGANSTVTLLFGSALTATPQGIFFDFSGSGVLQISTPDFSVSWQLQGDIFADELARESAFVQTQVTHPPGSQQIGVGASPSFPLGLSLAQVRVREETEDGLRFRANFTLDLCVGDNIDPTTEPVSLTISTPIGNVYPAGPNVFPIQPGEFELVLDPAGRRWRLTDAARQRTGIERFDIDDRDGSIVFVDRGVALPPQAYESLTLELTIGNDSGRAVATLVEEPCDSGRWRVGR